jgi:phosphatidylinositol alpha-mannosyltransferase
MRVGVVCPYDLSRPGGVQAQVMGLSRTLRELGEETSVIGPGLPDGVAGVNLGSTISLRGNRSVVPLSADPRVAGLIEEAAHGLDLLHVHEPLMPFVSLRALRAGPSVVATFHAAPGLFGLGLYGLIGSRLGKVLGPNVKRLTAVSSSARDPLPDDVEVSIIPNGVDVGAFRVGAERRPRRVVFLGRDEPRKGLDLLLEAWEDVVKSVPDAELVVMGAHRETEGVNWLGTVDDATKTSMLGSAAIYVAPNTGRESFGIVLVEAMAAGAAVVASDLASFKEVAGESAVFFERGNADDLSWKLIELLRDEERRRALSEAGPARAARYDWSTVAENYRDVYLAALA